MHELRLGKRTVLDPSIQRPWQRSGYEARHINSKLNGKDSKFGALQAPATIRICVGASLPEEALFRFQAIPATLGDVVRFFLLRSAGSCESPTHASVALSEFSRFRCQQGTKISQALSDEAPNLRQMGIDRVGPTGEKLVGDLA